MDVMEAIKKRKSVRNYLDKQVDEKKLDLILEAARLAPSAGNRQEWRLIVVKDKAVRDKLMKAAKDQPFVGQAPVVIVCCAQTDGHIMTCGQLCYPIDVAIAIDHMTLKAAEEGLGSCWVGAFREDTVKEILGIPREIKVVELLTIGYAVDEIAQEKNRLPIDEVVMYDSWNKKEL